MSRSDNRGFTLVEVMIAMFILLIGILALLQAVNVSTMQNLNNQLRNEAIQVGEDYMKDLLRRPTFDQLSAATGDYTFGDKTAISRLRGQKGSYTVKRSVTKMGANSAELKVRLEWQIKNNEYFHELHSVKSLQ